MTVRFTDGLARIAGAPPSAPSLLRNARLMPGGEVEAMRAGTALGDPPPLTGPWIEREWSLPEWWPEGTPYVAPSSYVDGLGAVAVRHGRRIYTTSGEMDLRRVEADGGVATPPCITGVTHAPGPVGGGAPSNGSQVAYVIIPIGGEDESGPWEVVAVPAYGDGAATVLTIAVSRSVRYVEVYRSLDLAPAALATTRGGYFLIGRVPVTEGPPDLPAYAYVTDVQSWTEIPDAEDTPTPQSVLLGNDGRRLATTWAGWLGGAGPLSGSGGAVMNPVEGPGGTPLAASARHVRAEAAYEDARVFLYGGVRIPTKVPAIVYADATAAPDAPVVAFQYEYAGAQGPVYGPRVSIEGATKVAVAARDFERALLVFHDGHLIERIDTLSSSGRFISKYRGDASYSGVPTEYPAGVTSYTELPATSNYAVSLYVDDRRACLLSRQDRPWEVTFDSFRTEESGGIVALAPARLAESEGVRSYGFYVFSERGIFAAERAGRSVSLVDVSRTLTIKRDGAGRALVAPTTQGLACVLSDGHVYVLSGRDVEGGQLSSILTGRHVAAPLFSAITDIAYDATAGVVYVLASPPAEGQGADLDNPDGKQGGLYGFMLATQAWREHHDGLRFDGASAWEAPLRIGFDRRLDGGRGALIVRTSTGAFLPFVGGAALVPEPDGAPARSPLVVSSPLVQDDSVLRSALVRADYVRDGLVEANRATYAEALGGVRGGALVAVTALPAREHAMRLAGRGLRVGMQGFTRLRSLDLRILQAPLVP